MFKTFVLNENNTIEIVTQKIFASYKQNLVGDHRKNLKTNFINESSNFIKDYIKFKLQKLNK